MTEEPELAWSAAQVAKAIGVSKTWLDQMRLNGNGPLYVKIGRRVLYRPSDVDDWLKTHRRRSTSDE